MERLGQFFANPSRVLLQSGKILGLFALFLLSSCVKLSGSLTKIKGANDFKRSSMIVSGTAVANGSDQLVVYVRLLNSDSSVVKAYKPTYNIKTGSAILPSECFESDNNGLAICILRATTPGTRTMAVTNIALDLEKQIEFTPIPNNNNILQISSGGNQHGTAGAYKVRGTIGNPTQDLKQTASGYTVYATVQGAIAANARGSH